MPRRSPARPLLATLLLLGGACEGPRASAPDLALVPTGDTIRTTLYEATDAAWLGGSRWAVLSPADQRVVLLDFGTRTATDLAAGVKDAYRGPFALFPVDSTLYVSDWALRRVTAWSPTGGWMGPVPIPANDRGVLPSARDRAGNWYLQLNPAPGTDGSGSRDSAVVVRVSADLATADTVLRLTPLDLAQVDGDAGPRFERRVFSGEDAWGVLGDGSIWVARVYPNRVDWIDTTGIVQEGQQLPDRVFTITPADREQWLRRFPGQLRTAAEKVPFSPVKPPFEMGFTGGGGNVWLEKSRVIPDTVRRYQAVGRDGRLHESVWFSGYGKALAASPDAVLVREVEPTGIRFVLMARAQGTRTED